MFSYGNGVIITIDFDVKILKNVVSFNVTKFQPLRLI